MVIVDKNGKSVVILIVNFYLYRINLYLGKEKAMSDFFIYYMESNVVCVILFLIMLIHDWLNVDKQEKQVKFDYALLAFMGYFISDSIWAGIIENIIPKTRFSVVTLNFINFVFMAVLTYTWLHYVWAETQSPKRNIPFYRVLSFSPFLASVIALVFIYLVAPQLLITDDLNITFTFLVFQIAVPIIYVMTVVVISIGKAIRTIDSTEKRKLLYIGFYPLMVVVGGVIQIVFLPRVPIFCFASTVLMLIFYVRSMEKQISLDPLTGLNNRSQLRKYVSQDNFFSENHHHSFVVMMDVNDFKHINDTYGHSEGDQALLIISKSLKDATKDLGLSAFLGRYGGDEFILIVHSLSEADVINLIEKIREHIRLNCKLSNTSYLLTIGAGFNDWDGEKPTFIHSMQLADQKMYENKEYIKKQLKQANQ